MDSMDGVDAVDGQRGIESMASIPSTAVQPASTRPASAATSERHRKNAGPLTKAWQFPHQTL